MALFWVAAPCSPVEVYRRFRGTVINLRAMMKAARTSETSINFYQTARHNNPEDGHLLTRRLENLKYHYLEKKPLLYVQPR
jgi:hypothetical protein